MPHTVTTTPQSDSTQGIWLRKLDKKNQRGHIQSHRQPVNRSNKAFNCCQWIKVYVRILNIRAARFGSMHEKKMSSHTRAHYCRGFASVLIVIKTINFQVKLFNMRTREIIIIIKTIYAYTNDMYTCMCVCVYCICIFKRFFITN